MKQFRCSFSVLEPWSKGDYDEALKRYFKTDQTVTPQMEMGKLLHEQWRTETQKSLCLPKVFGGQQLGDFQAEHKMESMIDGWINFVGIIDLLEEEHTIHEYKTGGADSLTYSRTMQTKVYQALCMENGMNPQHAIIRHYNQYTQKVTTSYQYLSPVTLKEGYEWITTYASEMASAMQESGQL